MEHTCPYFTFLSNALALLCPGVPSCRGEMRSPCPVSRSAVVQAVLDKRQQNSCSPLLRSSRIPTPLHHSDDFNLLLHLCCCSLYRPDQYSSQHHPHSSPRDWHRHAPTAPTQPFKCLLLGGVNQLVLKHINMRYTTFCLFLEKIAYFWRIFHSSRMLCTTADFLCVEQLVTPCHQPCVPCTWWLLITSEFVLW